MRYPVKSETFATNDIAALSALNLDLCVLALRGSANQSELLHQRSVAHVPLVSAKTLVQLGWRQLLKTPKSWLAAAAWTVRLNLARPIALLKSVWLYPASVGAAAWATSSECDIVHLRWGHYPSLVGALLKRWNSPVKVTLSLSAYDLEADLPITRHLAPLADAVRTLGAVNVPDITKLFGIPEADVSIIYDGVPESALGQENPEKEPGLIVTASRLIPSKRVDDVIRAVAQVIDARHNVRLTILGDGPQKEELVRLAAQLGIGSHVEFKGMVPYLEVLEVMNTAEIFVMLSDKSSERLPNVVKEALAASCAVVSSYTPGIEELITDGVSGQIVPPRNPDAASAAILRFLDSHDFRASVAAAGRTHIRNNFRLADCAAKYVQLWERLTLDTATSRSPSGQLPALEEGGS